MMTTTHPDPMNEQVSVDQLEDAIRANFSPEGAATIIAFLQPAAFYKPANDDARRALMEVEWFAERLTAMLGVETHNRLMEELGL